MLDLIVAQPLVGEESFEQDKNRHPIRNDKTNSIFAFILLLILPAKRTGR